MNGKNYIYKCGGVFIKSMVSNGDERGIAQHRYPLSFELVGKKLDLESDGKAHSLSFKDRKTAVLDGAERGYECLKCAAGLYFVRIGTDAALVDFSSGAVTLALEEGFVTCVIKGAENAKAHQPAGDAMAGTNVRWMLGVGKYTEQRFLSADKAVVSWEPKDDVRTEVGYEAVHAGEGYYLVRIEAGAVKGVCAPFFSDHMIMLQDYERCMTYGCLYGKGYDPILFTGYASFI